VDFDYWDKVIPSFPSPVLSLPSPATSPFSFPSLPFPLPLTQLWPGERCNLPQRTPGEVLAGNAIGCIFTLKKHLVAVSWPFVMQVKIINLDFRSTNCLQEFDHDSWDNTPEVLGQILELLRQ